MPDSSAIDQAIVDRLLADATLAGLMPDGVYIDEAPANRTRFVIVALIESTDVQVFGGRGYEDAIVLVKAVARRDVDTGDAFTKAAAARIDALLDPQPPAAPAPLTAAGYAPIDIRRIERVRVTEVDAVDSSIRWHHRGGQYRVLAAPA